MRTPASISAATLVLAWSGCGTTPGAATTSTQATRDAHARLALAAHPAAGGEVLARGDASPAEHGPYRLAGRYRARFEQVAPEDPGLDFTGETAFVAHLQSGARSIALLRAAARTGSAEVRVPAGRWRVIVDFGDYPYAIRLTPDQP